MTILFFAHGGEAFLNEVTFAVLSYYQHHQANENKIVIYTDNVAHFQQVLPPEITYVSVTPAQVKQWRGTIDFVHRVKIEVLRDAMQRFPNETFLYLDSDVYFKQNITFLEEKIQRGTPVMSLQEGSIFGSHLRHFKALASYLREHQNTIDIDPPIVVSPQQKMYNAGIIGLSANDKPIVEQALAFTDFLHSFINNHVTEQFAFTVLLSQKGTIYEAEPHIHHYWYFKEFREIITQFLEKNKGKSFETLVALSTKVNPECMGAEKLAYKRMNFWQKLWQKMTKGRKWKIIYE
ncbi:hypothetical protein ACSQ7D_02990 [Capnocytophaga sp. G1920]|uniref:hypothetical protein n=1 Tax=Capnocytophaga sp. G1920 TaxID=3448875 RepID=UPI003EDC2762